MPRTRVVWLIIAGILLTRCSADRTPSAPRRASQGKERGIDGFGGAGGGRGLSSDSAAEPSAVAPAAPMGKMAPKPSKAGSALGDKKGSDEEGNAASEAGDSNLQEIVDDMDVAGERKSPSGVNLGKLGLGVGKVGNKQDPAAKATERELHYEGTLQYRTNSGTELLTMIESKVKSLGGYAEKRAPDSAKFQVPQKSFLALQRTAETAEFEHA